MKKPTQEEIESVCAALHGSPKIKKTSIICSFINKYYGFIFDGIPEENKIIAPLESNAMCGFFGCAFLTKDKKSVVKVTSDSTEGYFYNEVQLNNKFDSEIYCKGVVHMHLGNNFWTGRDDVYIGSFDIIFREYVLKLERVDEHELRELSIISKYVKAIDKYDRYLEFSQKRVRTDRQLVFLNELIRLRNNGLIFGDIDPENIGLREDGNFCIFDTGKAIFLDKINK